MQNKNSVPLFSVVIPTFNHGHLISKCLDSVIAQTYNNWEAIVVNNFSTDNTIDVVNSKGDSRIRLINFSNDGIIAASRNVGIRNSNAEWLCFLDSDDFWYPTKLEETIPFLKSFDLIYHDLNINKNNKIYKNRKLRITREIKGDPYIDMLSNTNPIIGSSVVARTELVKRADGFSEKKELITVEDFDLWLRLAKMNCRFHYIPKSLGAYFIGNTNLSKPSLKFLQKYQAIYSIHLKDVDLKLRNQINRNIAYAFGRVCQLAGEYNQGINFYKKALFSNKPQIVFKSLIFIVLSIFKILKMSVKNSVKFK